VRRRQRTTNGFQRRFTPADIRLLAQMDELHQTPNGYAMKKLCERAFEVFGDTRFKRLASISVSHLYRLRKTTTYRRRGLVVDKTRPREVAIGERRAPQAKGEPGYLRVDSVHQGDFERRKGVYHVNAVDETTQYEIVVTVERIGEHYLIPALLSLMDQFPFKIQGFHTDNGSEYINYRVAGMLNKLLVEFTKSRRRTSNDNALVEGKNGSVVRKVFGHAHIPQRFAELINTFNREYLNPHLNFHRPCLFAHTQTDARGKQNKIYPYEEMYTPYEKFKSLVDAQTYLKPDMSFEILDALAHSISDNESARRLKAAYGELNQHIHGPDRQRA
jgi:transposase InsO family protein